ncbi:MULTISPECIES: DUF2306 domain-containing protein [Hyphobacterium]|uniref:DUF2306 domain-containing protein n=1 Tax=Hyphobacterium vulgare TaxID=1736751 RepID=A0ABV6ZVT0_9PROT
MNTQVRTDRDDRPASGMRSTLINLGGGFAALSVVLLLVYWQATDGNLSLVADAFGGVDWSINPDLGAFAKASWVIQLHASTAIGALVLGTVQMFAPKGTIPHRTVGYVWAVLMVTTAVSAIFIRQINDGGFSFIHIFVPITLMAVYGMIANARRGLINKHRNAVYGAFFGALVVPGLFAFMPGRLMHVMVFGG